LLLLDGGRYHQSRAKIDAFDFLTLRIILLLLPRRNGKDITTKVSIANAKGIIAIVLLAGGHAHPSAHQDAFLGILSFQSLFLAPGMVFQSALVIVVVIDLLLDLLKLIKDGLDEHVRGPAEARVGEQVVRAHAFYPGERASEARLGQRVPDA
jgi:hypothetical protein